MIRPSQVEFYAKKGNKSEFGLRPQTISRKEEHEMKDLLATIVRQKILTYNYRCGHLSVLKKAGDGPFVRV